MVGIWQFFETMDEMVYVSDMETNEIVYLNAHLRKNLGIKDGEDYSGQKCHTLIQGKSVPCDFCNNSRLEPGKFVSWIHSNPILKKTVRVKNTVICKDGRRYRIEIAIDVNEKKMDGQDYIIARTESILNECAQKVFSEPSPEKAMNRLLEYIGTVFASDRAYIFEIYENGKTDNTYEWCFGEATPQMEALQDETMMDWWIEAFEKSEMIVIPDLEEIRDVHPTTYATLKPQDIHSLVTAPIMRGKKLIGFFGVDNPDRRMIPLTQSVFKLVGFFLDTLMRQRDGKEHLEQLSFRDALTGVRNRNALFEDFQEKKETMESFGVIYCDVTGLKQVNDSLGHDEGDRLLTNCCNILEQQFEKNHIYRIGGDEFVVLLFDQTEEEFSEIAEQLRENIKQSSHNMAIGYAWTDEYQDVIDVVLAEADKRMYKDKQEYYARMYIKKGVDRRHFSEQMKFLKKKGESEFDRFTESTYCDFESLCQSMTRNNSAFYLYFGDMQKDLFYVSDNMRDTFGLQGNVIPGLLKIWEERISNPEHREMYQQDLADMLENKRTVQDLRYQVRDAEGNEIWVRCYGLLKWNEDQTAPLFFSGRVSCQDSDFVVDPLTNFLRDDAAIRRMVQCRGADERRTMVGFSLNCFTEINNTKGRAYGNRLIQMISNKLLHEFTTDMTFYRLDGMNFLAIINPEADGHMESLIRELRSAVESCYRKMGVPVRDVCSFCLIDKKKADFEPEEFLSTLNVLIKSAKNNTDQLYVEYSRQMIRDLKIQSDMALELSKDVMNGMNHFRIMVQPVVSAEDGHVVSGEVLLRWNFREETISPTVFISILEAGNMIQAVGRWVFEQAVRACRKALVYNPEFSLSFNVSYHQISDDGFLDFMKRMLSNYQLDGTHLVAELTETNFDESPQELYRFVEGCLALGIKVSLDDFGNAYSSLRMLLQYPSNIVKLDRSLLSELAESKEKMKFIRSIVFACHQFDKKVCVEGVENPLERQLVIEAGCDTIQGFYYYKPMELAAFYKLLRDESQGKR